ncbi:MAG: hypothetical protein HQM10_04190 [Candidatus Riflebacteria bacterium]|nr:hypothetical protein [Candidatus Riflebacteria bacterium]
MSFEQIQLDLQNEIERLGAGKEVGPIASITVTVTSEVIKFADAAADSIIPTEQAAVLLEKLRILPDKAGWEECWTSIMKTERDFAPIAATPTLQ